MKPARAWVSAALCVACGWGLPAHASASSTTGGVEPPAPTTAEIALDVDLLDAEAEESASASIRAQLLAHLASRGLEVRDQGELDIAFDVVEEVTDGTPSFVVRGRARLGEGEPVAIRTRCDDCSSRALVGALVAEIDDAIASTAATQTSASPATSVAPSSTSSLPADTSRKAAGSKSRLSSVRPRYVPGELGAAAFALMGSGTFIAIVGAGLWGGSGRRSEDDGKRLRWAGMGTVGFGALSILVAIPMVAVDVHRQRRGRVSARPSASLRGAGLVLEGRF